MTDHLEVRAEQQRLARMLRIELEQLHYLEALPGEELRVLRNQVADVLFATNTMLERIAATNKLIPAPMAATIGEKVFGPVVVARLAQLLPPDRAVEIAARVSVGFLADVGAIIDPRRVEAILAKIPAARIGEVTAELVRRKEYVALGSYVASLPDASLRSALAVTDPESLLQEALMLEHKDRLAHLYDLAPAGRYEEMFALAPSLGLTEEARELLAYFSEAQRETLEAALSAATV